MSPCHWAALLKLRRNLDILIFLRQQFGMLESVCQWPLITSSCLPVTMGSTNSLIFKENNFRKCFFVAFGFICTGLCHFTDRLNDFIECMYVYVNKQLAVSPQTDVTDSPKSCIFEITIIEDKATRRVLTIMRKMRKTDSIIVTADKIRIRIRPAMLSKKGAYLRNRETRPYYPGIRTSLGQIQTEI